MKKNIIFTIIITALLTCLITNTVRDIMFVQSHDGLLEKVQKVADIIDTHSIYETDSSKMSDMASEAIAFSMNDPYTRYYSKQAFSDKLIDMNSSYLGIGVTLSVDPEADKLVIMDVSAGQSAHNHGVMKGDFLLAVNGTPYSSEQLDEAAAAVRGSGPEALEGSTVTLTLERNGETIDITVTREIILKNTVSSKLLDNGIGYINITQFSPKDPDLKDSTDTSEDFNNQLDSLEAQGITSLIIDLRDNPGGELDTVLNIADRLLPSGIIMYTENKKGARQNYTSDEKSTDLPIVVLINEESASASEVLSGALKDSGKATLVGEKSFGKGVVQVVIPLSDGSGVTVTTEKYFTPSGTCIHGTGIEPHIVVPFETNKLLSDLTYEEDIQLQKAVEVLLSNQQS